MSSAGKIEVPPRAERRPMSRRIRIRFRALCMRTMRSGWESKPTTSM